MVDYVISGLRVASDIELPGLIVSAAPHDDADVAIRAGDVPAVLDTPEAHGPNWAMAGERFLIAVPGIVRMLLTGGRTLVYALDPGVSPSEAAIFVSGTGFGILLQQRGRVVLHASAIRVGARAVLFSGPSGAGKSTIAAAFVNAGYDLLTDDLGGVSMPRGSVPYVHPDGRQMKLWAMAIDRLSLADRRVAQIRPQIRKYYVEPARAVAAPLPIAALYVLREERATRPYGIEQPNIVDSALLVQHNAYRPQLVRRMRQQPLYFQAAAAIAQAGGVFTLTRPLRFDAMPATVARLEAHWRTLGLLEGAA